MYKFRWVGRNKTFGTITIKEGLTTKDILENNYPSFFSLDCRSEIGNCEFLAENFLTGLKDINGKEIYEGDIIKYKYEGKEFIREVKWDKCICGFYPFCNPIDYDEVYIDIKKNHVEIIGNIYETPHLLTQRATDGEQ